MAPESKQIWTTGSRPVETVELRVQGVLGPTLLEAFPTLTARRDGHDTLLGGALGDQSQLFGVLREIEALGLTLLELRVAPTLASSQTTDRRKT